MVGILIVAHGDFGAYLLEAAEEIVGRNPKQKAVSVSVSRRLPLALVQQKIAVQLEAILKDSQGHGVLALCDMLGGTPCNETMMLAQRYSDVEVVSGVNLYMVVSAFVNAQKMNLQELAAKVTADAQRSVVNVKARLTVQR